MSHQIVVTIQKLLAQAKNVAIFVRSHDDLDALSAALAIAQIGASHGQECKIYPGNKPQIALDFIGPTELIIPAFAPNQELIISVPTQTTKISGLSYKKEEDQLTITVSPKTGYLNPSLIKAKINHASVADLILVLGTPKLEQLGERFNKFADVFYKTPIINIDYHAEGEAFGKANFIDWSAHSCCEMVYSLFKDNPSTITKQVTTALLCGVMASTESFQKQMTSPQEFDLTATLIELGANQQEVVRNLYRTKPLEHLKLSGRLLKNLQASADEKVIWTTLNQDDFKKTHASPEILHQIVKIILGHSTRAKLIGISYEHKEKNYVGICIIAPQQISALNLAEKIKKMAKVPANCKGNEKEAHLSLYNLSLDQAAQLFKKTCDLFIKPRYTEIRKHELPPRPPTKPQPYTRPQRPRQDYFARQTFSQGDPYRKTTSSAIKGR